MTQFDCRLHADLFSITLSVCGGLSEEMFQPFFFYVVKELQFTFPQPA